MIDIPYAMRKSRKGLGLSQEEMAQLLDVTTGTIWNWENGKGEPSASQWLFVQDLMMRHATDIMHGLEG